MLRTLFYFIISLSCFGLGHYLDITYPYSLGVVIPIGAIMTLGVIFAFVVYASACDWLLNDQSPEYNGRKKVKKTRA